MNFNTRLGNKIKETRTNLNLNQEDFVKKLGINISRASLSKIESGKQMPSAEIIKNIIECYNVSPYWLLDIKNISNDNNDLNKKYEMLSNEDKKSLDKYIDFLLKQNESNLYTSTDLEINEENKKSS